MGFWQKRVQALGHAGRGLGYFWQSGSHPKIHIVMAIFSLLLGLFFSLKDYEWLALILTICLVISLEALNSALEYSLDLCHPHWHLLAKKAKDIAAGAVLVAALGAALVGLIIFIPKFLELCKSLNLYSNT